MAKKKVEEPVGRELRLPDVFGWDTNAYLTALNRNTALAASAAQKGDVLKVENKVDGHWYIYYYYVLSDGYTDFTHGKYVYWVRKLADEKEALALVNTNKNVERLANAPTVFLMIQETNRWIVRVRVDSNAEDPVAYARNKFYEAGSHAYLEDIDTVYNDFDVIEVAVTEEKAEYVFDEEGHLAPLDNKLTK